ncbi:MAG: SAM-dependent methyltransferase [Nitrospira sp.]
MNNLTSVESHFRFGENWRAYAEKVDEAAIEEAVHGLRRLAGSEMSGKRILDIGCGSGLHALAALRLGAVEIQGIDLDPNSVAAAQAVLTRYASQRPWKMEQKSIFEMNPAQCGTFDMVYSWGVLHHTGDMFRAIHTAAELVSLGGLFVFALYRKTLLCPFWKWEKRWYARASSRRQRLAQRLYTAMFRLGLRATGHKFDSYVDKYKTKRGMDFYHDVHDWLGGWPYESISPEEVELVMRGLGFEQVRSFITRGRRFGGRYLGLFGSGCDEYVYRKVETFPAPAASIISNLPQ